MEEYKNTQDTGEQAPAKGKFAVWLENFIYHYKWHTIAVVFILIVVIVCTVQLFNRESYDTLIVYAGSKDVSKVASSGDVAEIVTLETSLKTVVDDYDDNGEVNIGLETLFWLSNAEIEALEKELSESDSDVKEELNYSLITSNRDTVDSLMLYSDYFVWMISDDLYEYYLGTSGGADRFVTLDGLVESGTDVEYYGGTDTHAIYLRSTAFYDLPGIRDLPDDTLIIVRALGVGATNSKEKAYENGIDIAKKMINFD